MWGKCTSAPRSKISKKESNGRMTASVWVSRVEIAVNRINRKQQTKKRIRNDSAWVTWFTLKWVTFHSIERKGRCRASTQACLCGVISWACKWEGKRIGQRRKSNIGFIESGIKMTYATYYHKQPLAKTPSASRKDGDRYNAKRYDKSTNKKGILKSIKKKETDRIALELFKTPPASPLKVPKVNNYATRRTYKLECHDDSYFWLYLEERKRQRNSCSIRKDF